MIGLKISDTAIWLLATLYFAMLFFEPLRPFLLFPVIVFSLLHGARRYGWRSILTLLVITIVVSNTLEVISIKTGFPFGHYHYTAAIGPMIGPVPVVLGFAYFSTAYLAWVISTVLVGEVRSHSQALTTFAVPFIAAFVMTAWDLGVDPSASTIDHKWIWEQGGGYFGVPLSNFLGWFFTTFIIFQAFAVFLRTRTFDFRMPFSHKLQAFQAITLYGLIGLNVVVVYLTTTSIIPGVDKAHVIWNSGNIAEAEAVVTIFTMIFCTILSMIKLLLPPADAR